MPHYIYAPPYAGFSPSPATSRSGTVIDNYVCVCVLACLLAQLTDKMDPMYIIPKDLSE